MTNEAAAAALAIAEPDVIEHMNADHADTIDLFATRLLRRRGPGWRLTGVDPEGCDLNRGPFFARLHFPRSVQNAADLRAMLTELAAVARESRG